MAPPGYLPLGHVPAIGLDPPADPVLVSHPLRNNDLLGKHIMEKWAMSSFAWTLPLLWSACMHTAPVQQHMAAAACLCNCCLDPKQGWLMASVALLQTNSMSEKASSSTMLLVLAGVPKPQGLGLCRERRSHYAACVDRCTETTVTRAIGLP